MKSFKEDFKNIYQGERGGLILMIFNLFFSIGLFVFSATKLNPNSALIKIGYGDLGGYRDGAWGNLLVFPLLAVLFGILHNLLAVRIYHKRGGVYMKLFLTLTTFLIVGTFFLVVRLTSGG